MGYILKTRLEVEGHLADVHTLEKRCIYRMCVAVLALSELILPTTANSRSEKFPYLALLPLLFTSGHVTGIFIAECRHVCMHTADMSTWIHVEVVI